MVKEAEQFADQDEALKKTIDARNGFESASALATAGSNQC